MKLLLFGGTFDPPHIGHMGLLRNAIAATHPDRVLVVPSRVPPHKQASATPARLRLAMCDCFEPLCKNMEISDIEIRRQGKSYTIDTVLALEERFPGAEVLLCVGSDMLLSFATWYRWEALLHRVTLVVQSRVQQGTPALKTAAESLRRQGGRVQFVPGDSEEVSSSEIRQMIQSGDEKAAYELIPPPADDIVRQNHLYSST